MAATVSSHSPIPAPAPAPPHHSGTATEPFPTAAQILLQDFNLPAFPDKASSLQALTLTSDIKPTDYAELLNSISVSALDSNTLSVPQEIEALTLELFSLGYPPLFLSNLGKALPKLKILTLYSQLLDGVSDASRKDAGDFFNDVLVGKKENGGGLRELHLLDVFFRKGFMAGIGGILEDLHQSQEEASSSSSSRKGVLRFLEVSYTYRGHSDSSFLSRILGDELPTMLVPSLIAVSFSLAAPVSKSNPADTDSEFLDDPADVDENGVPIPGRKPEGIIPLAHSNLGVAILMRKLTAEASTEIVAKGSVDDDREADDEEEVPLPGSGPGPRSLKMLDMTIYTLDTNQLTDIVRSQQDLAVLSVSVLVSGNTTASKTSLLDALRGGQDSSNSGKDLEIVEIVGVPDAIDQDTAVNTASPTEQLLHNVFPSASDMVDLSTHLPRLSSFKMTILRAESFGSVNWDRLADGSWADGVTKSEYEA